MSPERSKEPLSRADLLRIQAERRLSGEVSDPADVHFREEGFRVLQQVIADKLNSKEQVVLRSKYFNNMTPAEIAAELGIPVAQVSRLENKALGKLRRNPDIHSAFDIPWDYRFDKKESRQEQPLRPIRSVSISDESSTLDPIKEEQMGFLLSIFNILYAQWEKLRDRFRD